MSGSCDPAQPVAVRELGVCLLFCMTDSVCNKVAPGARCVEFEGAGKVCVVLQCDDSKQNRGEAGIDCGGVCTPFVSCGDGGVQKALVERFQLNSIKFDVYEIGRQSKDNIKEHR